jgi:hypothetical protein
MRLSHIGGSDPSALPVGLLLVGLPAFDVALVTYSRRRRGLPIVTGGRDHLTHRLLGGLRSPRRVGATLAVAQGTLALVAIGGHELAGGTIWFVGAGCVAVALVLIPLLESQFPAAVTDRRHRVESETFPMGRDEGPLTPARAANDPTP